MATFAIHSGSRQTPNKQTPSFEVPIRLIPVSRKLMDAPTSF